MYRKVRERIRNTRKRLKNDMRKSKKLVKHKAKPIVIYGEQPEKSMLILRKAGFEQVYTLKGGLAAWLQASYPVKKKSSSFFG